MRNTVLSIIAIFSFITSVYTQPLKSTDDRIKTSTVVPNLSDANSGWQKVGEQRGTLFAVEYKGQQLVVQGSQAYYVNAKDNMKAYVYSKTDTNGKSEEVGMLYGTDNVARGAVKVDGKWYASKELYFDNGQQNPKGWIDIEMGYDEHEKDKPVKVKCVLETVEGKKEVVMDLK